MCFNRNIFPVVISESTAKGVNVTIYTDNRYNTNKKKGNMGGAEAYSDTFIEGKNMLIKSGAEIVMLGRTHGKVVCVDDTRCMVGSFNWLSATREKESPSYKENRTMVYTGKGVEKLINDELKTLNIDEKRIIKRYRAG